MYRSLTLLATDQAIEAQDKPRLIRLAKHKNLMPMTKALGFATGVVMLTAHMLVMAATSSDFPWIAYAIETLIVVVLLSRARNNFRKAQLDPLRLCTQAAQEYEFADAKIVGATVRREGVGSRSYEVIDALIDYQSAGKTEPLQILETFDKSIWNFEPAQFPISARVVLKRDSPGQASLVSISKWAVEAIPQGKKRSVRGYSLGFAIVIVLFLFSAACLVVGLFMIAEKLGIRTR